MIDSGDWQTAFDETLGTADFVPGPGNPPEPEPCS